MVVLRLVQGPELRRTSIGALYTFPVPSKSGTWAR